MNIVEGVPLTGKSMGPSESAKQHHGRLATQCLINSCTSPSFRHVMELGSSEYLHLIHIISIHESLRLQAHILAPGT